MRFSTESEHRRGTTASPLVELLLPMNEDGTVDIESTSSLLADILDYAISRRRRDPKVIKAYLVQLASELMSGDGSKNENPVVRLMIKSVLGSKEVSNVLTSLIEKLSQASEDKDGSINIHKKD